MILCMQTCYLYGVKRGNMKKVAKELAFQVGLATGHESALPELRWLISVRKRGQAPVELRKVNSGGKSSPALQMKMASSKLTSSLSRAREATRSPTSLRLVSLCR